MNGPAVGLGAGLAIAFGLAMSLAASPRPGRLAVVAWLRDAAHGATTGRAGAGARNLLVVSQVAMALVLTIGAGLLTSSYLNLARIDLGYRPAEVLALTLTPQGRRVRGRRAQADRDLVAGRTFSDRDTTDAPAAVIVSESLARYLWPSGDAVGRRLLAIGAEADSDGAPAWQTVVGVVADARYRELERGRFDLYVPFTQVSMGLNHLVIRTEGDPVQLAAALRSAVRRADPNFVIDSITPLRGLVDDVMRPWRFNMTMATLLAALAAGLAAIGLFGTVAYGVARRTREIGVRRALGARAVDVLRLVCGQAVAFSLLGAVIGLGVALPAGELLRPLLFGVAPREAGTFGVLTALFLAVCAAASLFAAWRATRIDPLAALRETE